jgi:hypothetical protein
MQVEGEDGSLWLRCVKSGSDAWLDNEELVPRRSGSKRRRGSWAEAAEEQRCRRAKRKLEGQVPHCCAACGPLPATAPHLLPASQPGRVQRLIGMKACPARGASVPAARFRAALCLSPCRALWWSSS